MTISAVILILGSAAAFWIVWPILARLAVVLVDAVVLVCLAAFVVISVAVFVIVSVGVLAVRASFWIADGLLLPFWSIADRVRDRRSS